jgi:chaperonin GroES
LKRELSHETIRSWFARGDCDCRRSLSVEKQAGRKRNFFCESYMRIEPLGDKIVVKRMEADEKTDGGILLPESAREKPQQGRVLSVGTGQLLENGSRAKPQVDEGDRVLFSSYAGTEVNVDGSKLLIMAESDILAVLQ